MKTTATIVHVHACIDGKETRTGFLVMKNGRCQYEFGPDEHGFEMAKALARAFNGQQGQWADMNQFEREIDHLTK